MGSMEMAFDPFDDEFFKRFFRRLKDFDRKFEEMEKKFKFDFREFERAPGVSGFKIEVRDFGDGKPEVKVTRIGKPSAGVATVQQPEVGRTEHIENQREIKPISRMLETNVGKIERLDEVVLTMQAPGVRKEDAELRQVGNAVEIIARKPSGEAYFAAFELPPDITLNKRQVEMKGDMLVISIPRRRRPSTGFR